MAWGQHAAIQSRGQHFPVDKTIGTPPAVFPEPGGTVFPVERMAEMRFDESGGHTPPPARHLFPGKVERSVRLFRFP